MVSKNILSFILAAAVGISSVSAAAVAVPEAAPAPFVIPDDVEILDLRTEEDKALTPLSKRVNGGIYVCKAINFDASQGCKLIVTSWGADTSLLNTDYNNVISSAGADAGTTCQFYDAYSGSCTGQGYLYIDNPGISDFRNFPWNNGAGNWNDITSCIKCWY
ncbi:hypothetical protein B0O99DRAFT_685244 [Bisporella sp. PMI_857]|nr:hypothetical protein B0O99DRAFT_685244 [Bisporella sp. PMI_857]